MSNNLLKMADEAVLDGTGLQQGQLESVLGQMMGHQIDYADLYFQLSRHESWALEDGIVKEGGHSIEQGVGVRAISGEKTGFAYSDDIHLEALQQAAGTARSIARSGGQGEVPVLTRHSAHQLYLPMDPIDTLSAADKISLLQSVDQEARRLDPRITQVNVSMAAVHDVVLVASSDGTYAADIRPLVRLNVSVVAEQNGRRERGSAGGGGRTDFSLFTTRSHALDYAREAVRQALVNLEAVEAPAGSHAGGAGSRLARRAAARGHRPRPGGRLQPQGHLGLRRAHRRAGGLQPVYRGGRRHPGGAPRLAQRGR